MTRQARPWSHRFIQWLPLLALTSFYVCAFLLSVAGPIAYVGYRPLELVPVLALFLASFCCSYWVGSSWRSFRQQAGSGCMGSLFKLSTLIAIISGVSSGALRIDWLNGNPLALSAGADRYAQLYSESSRGSGEFRTWWLLSELAYPFVIVSLSIGVYRFNALTGRWRAAVVWVLLATIMFQGVAAGKNKGLGDVAIVVAFLGALPALAQGRSAKLWIAGFGVACVALLMTIATRYGRLGVNLGNIAAVGHFGMVYTDGSFDAGSWLGEMEFALVQLSSYVTQGFYGLDRCMQLPFVWTQGLGNSYTLSYVFDQIGLVDMAFNHSYPVRAGSECDWGIDHWHTCIAWFAGDLTFEGAALFLGLCGAPYAMAWRGLQERNDLAAAPIFATLSIGLVFLPGNNQLLISPGGFLLLVLAFALWLPIGGLGRTREFPGRCN